MKYFFLILIFVSQSNLYCQNIPIGKSDENLKIYFDSAHSEIWTVGYYKPSNYNPITSEMIIYFHGQGGTQNEGYSLLKSIADKRGALLVSPTDGYPWSIAVIGYFDSNTQINYDAYLPNLIKQLYKYILVRENINQIPVRMLGFSAGGQCVTRYMLIRQGITDSIPLKMAISMNPYSYAFPSDSLNGIKIIYPFGIGRNLITEMDACSYSHIKSYYNENYTVLIGTADSINLGDTRLSSLAQGDNRYERAQNFYNFCQQDALEKGTSLKWYYAEVPNIGHDGYGLVNTKASPEDTVTILEHYLFDMPYHEPQKFPPTADFTYTVNDTTKCFEFNAACKCWWQTVPTTYEWDFGNDITASGINPKVNFTDNGMYRVQLIITNQYGSDTISKQLEVTNLIDASFIIIDSIETLPNANVSFFMETIYPTDSVLWDFGDSYTSQNVSTNHTYNQQGIYNVTLLKYRDQYCADTVRKTVRIIDDTELVENIDNTQIVIMQHDGLLQIKSLKEPISKIKILNVQGEIINQTDKFENSYEYSFSTESLYGIYICIVETNNQVFVKKVRFF